MPPPGALPAVAARPHGCSHSTCRAVFVLRGPGAGPSSQCLTLFYVIGVLSKSWELPSVKEGRGAAVAGAMGGVLPLPSCSFFSNPKLWVPGPPWFCVTLLLYLFPFFFFF